MKQPAREKAEASFYLKYVRDDIFLALFEERVFVKVGVCFHNLR